MMLKSICVRILLLPMLFLFACGGGGGGTPSGPTVLQGVFLDSAVEGMSYSSGSQSGTTDANGTFSYEQGATITFKIGDIVVGTANAQGVMTPISLVSGAVDENNSTVTNIVRFFMTIDDDNDPTNGIQITASVVTAAGGQSLDFTLSSSAFDADSNQLTVLTALTAATTSGASTLVTTSAAQTHLNDTLLSAMAGIYNGTYSGTTSGTWSIVVNANGTVTGSGCETATSTDFSATGSVSSDGVGALGFAGGASFAGNFSLTGGFSGTWTANGGTDTGTFTGSIAASSSGGTCSGGGGGGGASGTYTVTMGGTIGGYTFPTEVYATNFAAIGVPSSADMQSVEQGFVNSYSYAGTVSGLVVTFVTETEALIVVNYSATITPTGSDIGIAYSITYTYTQN